MDILVGIPVNKEEELREKTFYFLIKIMGYRNQLRMNHWQTTSYSEHKWTDKLINKLTKSIDGIGETALGTLGRPKITTVSTNISDNAIASSDWILEGLNNDVKEMLVEFKVTEYEGIISLLGELDSVIEQYKYLSTLG